jgi:hypothetical protein
MASPSYSALCDQSGLSFGAIVLADADRERKPIGRHYYLGCRYIPHTTTSRAQVRTLCTRSALQLTTTSRIVAMVSFSRPSHLSLVVFFHSSCLSTTLLSWYVACTLLSACMLLRSFAIQFGACACGPRFLGHSQTQNFSASSYGQSCRTISPKAAVWSNIANCGVW